MLILCWKAWLFILIYNEIETGAESSILKEKKLPEQDTYCIEGINQQISEMANRSTK